MRTCTSLLVTGFSCVFCTYEVTIDLWTQYFKTLQGQPNFWKTAEFTVLAMRLNEGLSIEVLNSVMAAILNTITPYFGR